MKNYIISILLLFSFVSFSQRQTSNCKVIPQNLQGTYEGDCKNRLAHGEGLAIGKETYEGSFKEGIPQGKGKYIYENGSYYVGEFKNVLRHGEGRMFEVQSVKAINKDSTEILGGKLGRWKQDEFIEEILEKKYTIIQNLNTLSTQFDKPDERTERVEIMLGTRSVLSGVSINPSSGTFYMQGPNKAIIENCVFPLRVRMNYNAQKGLSAPISVRLEFELESKGHWKINVNSQ